MAELTKSAFVYPVLQLIMWVPCRLQSWKTSGLLWSGISGNPPRLTTYVDVSTQHEWQGITKTTFGVSSKMGATISWSRSRLANSASTRRL